MSNSSQQDEDGGARLSRLNYNSYLKVPELLSLQHRLSSPPHHDEMFFIIIHQTAELWFKEMLHETEAFVQSFRDNSISRSVKILRRLVGILDLQVKQINLLATLTPAELAGFRNNLRTASGLQSMQFRLLEFAYGIRDECFFKVFEHFPEAQRSLMEWKCRPSVYDEFKTCLKAYGPGKKLKPDKNADLMSRLREIYENPGHNYDWVLLCETMLDFDEKFSQWRHTHVLMILRTIGLKQGTGGSSGYEFLKSRMDYRFFPELWQVRTKIGDHYEG